MNTSLFVFGIDAGGTSVRVALSRMDEPHTPVAVSAGAAALDGGPEPLRLLLPPLLMQAGVTAEQVVGVCAGVTKITRGGTKGRWEAALQQELPHARITVVPDYQIAFHGAVRGGVGLAVIAGTGSVAYGESQAVVGVRVGGRGWEFGDEGSGAWLTTEMVRRTLRALDGLEAPTPLTLRVTDALQTRDAALLGERSRQQIETAGRGFLVRLLREMAESGDREANNLYVGAGGWLAALARAGLTQLGFTEQDAPIVAAVGGVWEVGGILITPFTHVLCRWFPLVRVQPPDASSLIGALRVASRQANLTP